MYTKNVQLHKPKEMKGGKKKEREEERKKGEETFMAVCI